MDVPGAEHEMWREIVASRKRFHLKYLATQILLGRLVRSVRDDPTPDNISANALQLHRMFAHNANVPSVQDDLMTIFG